MSTSTKISEESLGGQAVCGSVGVTANSHRAVHETVQSEATAAVETPGR